MALMKSSTVPKDAVVLDELEASTYAWDLVRNWDSLADTWALHYSSVILGGINTLSGVIINRHYRHKLNLGKYGYFSSVIPITLMPGLMTALFHRHIVSSGLLLMKSDACPVCYEAKSAVIQCCFGIAYPLVLGPTSALMFANRYDTCRMPSLLEGPRVMFNFLIKLTRPLTGTLVTMGVCQFVASSVLTYFEMRNNFTLRTKMIEIEKKLMRERGLDAS